MAGIVDNKEVAAWKDRANNVLARPGESLASKSPAGAQEWESSLCGCCSPFSLCLMAYCLPCVVFGKTHHRINHDGDMTGYEPINASCTLFCCAAACGMHWLPASMQRAAIREKYNMKGSCCHDVIEACCCPLCALVQEEKETQLQAARVAERAAGAGAVRDQYRPAPGMTYPLADTPAPAAAAAAAPAAAAPAAAPATTAAPAAEAPITPAPEAPAAPAPEKN